MTSIDFTAAINAARDRALSAGTRPGDVDPDAEARQHLRALGAIAPGPAVAEALIAVWGHGVVPIDRDTLRATADPFAGYTAAAVHYQRAPHDGVGLQLGPHPAGTLFAVRGTAAAWSAWLAEHAEQRDITDDDGRIIASSRSYREIGRHCRVHWSPRGVAARSTPVVVGRAMIEAEGEKLRSDRAGVDNVGWLAWSTGVAWSVAGTGGLRLKFTDHKLGHGLELLANGVLPQAAARSDGWFLTSTGVPTTLDAADVPAWLVKALDAKLVTA